MLTLSSHFNSCHSSFLYESLAVIFVDFFTNNPRLFYKGHLLMYPF